MNRLRNDYCQNMKTLLLSLISQKNLQMPLLSETYNSSTVYIEKFENAGAPKNVTLVVKTNDNTLTPN